MIAPLRMTSQSRSKKDEVTREQVQARFGAGGVEVDGMRARLGELSAT